MHNGWPRNFVKSGQNLRHLWIVNTEWSKCASTVATDRLHAIFMTVTKTNRAISNTHKVQVKLMGTWWKFTYKQQTCQLSLKCPANASFCSAECHQLKSPHIYCTWQFLEPAILNSPALTQSMYEPSQGSKIPPPVQILHDRGRFIRWSDWGIRGFIWVHLVSQVHGNRRCS